MVIKCSSVTASEGKAWFWFLLPALFLHLRSDQPSQGQCLVWATQRCHHEVKGRGRMKLLGGQVPPWSPQGWAPIIKMIIFDAILLKFPSTPTFFPLNSGKKMKNPSNQQRQDEHNDGTECHKELWAWTTLNSSPIFPVAQQCCEKGISWWGSSSWRSWLLPPTTSSFASPLVLPQVPREKTYFKDFNPPKLWFWLTRFPHVLSDQQSCDQCHYLGQIHSHRTLDI